MDPETLKALVNGTIRETIREEGTKAGLDIEDPRFEKFSEAMHSLIARAADTKGVIDRMSQNLGKVHVVAGLASATPVPQKFTEKVRQENGL